MEAMKGSAPKVSHGHPGRAKIGVVVRHRVMAVDWTRDVVTRVQLALVSYNDQGGNQSEPREPCSANLRVSTTGGPCRSLGQYNGVEGSSRVVGEFPCMSVIATPGRSSVICMRAALASETLSPI